MSSDFQKCHEEQRSGTAEVAQFASFHPGILFLGSAPQVFAGWFQPSTLTMIVVVILIPLAVYRFGDFLQFLRSKRWKERIRKDP